MHLAILMRSDLNMRTGKMVAQGGHAAMMVGLSRFDGDTDGNLYISHEDASALRDFCKYPDVEVSFAHSQDMLLNGTDDHTDFHVVVDSGRTEFRGQLTMTCGASGVFPSGLDGDTPYTAPESASTAVRQYLIMSRACNPSKEAAIAMAGIGCLTEIEKCISRHPVSSAFYIDRAVHQEMFDWMVNGYPKIGLQAKDHEALKAIAERMSSANIHHTLVDYQGCQMIVTAPAATDKLVPFTGELKLL